MQNNMITYRNLDSPLGQMIAGATSKGLCFFGMA